MLHPISIHSLCYYSLVVFLITGCDIFSHSTDAPLNDPLTAPQELVVEGLRLRVEGGLGYDRMPAVPVPPPGLGMFARLFEVDSKPISGRLIIIELWVVQEEEAWKYTVKDSMRYSSDPSQIRVSCSAGPMVPFNMEPQLAVGSLADVILKIHILKGHVTFLLREPNVKVEQWE